MYKTRLLSRLLLALATGVLGSAGLTGCGSDVEVPDSLLRGKVTVDKKPVVVGTVTAYRGGDKAMETTINPDGTYEFVINSSGEYQLTVTGTDAKTPYGPPVKLPAKYADPAQSGLNTTVAAGQSNTYDIPLSLK